jgi:quercetin dioxygenase-like cupin family protein
MIAWSALQRSIAMDAATPKGSQTSDTYSHLVRPEGMEWQQTRFPGCEAKTLLFDRATGLMTALMRFAPGAVLPDHEHVNIEQTYVLEGHLVDKEGAAKGIEARAGEFVWREPGSRHVAWCPEGGTDAGDLPGPQQVLRSRRPRRRCRGPGLGRDLGSHRQELRRRLRNVWAF